VTAKGPFGETLLHKAAWRDRHSAAKLLLERGADVNARSPSGTTPLHEAAGEQPQVYKPPVSEKTVNLLLSYGAEVDIIVAAALGWTERVAQILDVDPGQVRATLSGRTPLHTASARGYVDIAELLLARGADVNQMNPETMETPLHVAVSQRQWRTARLLAERGADLGSRGRSGLTPLHMALSHPRLVRLLLAAGASVNVCDDEGRTPLHHAVEQGDTDSLALLLAHGAKVKVTDKFGWTPLHTACIRRNEAAADILLANGAEMDAFVAAAFERKDVLADLLGSDPSLANARLAGWPLLHWAAMSGNTEIVDLVLRHGADINAREDAPAGEWSHAFAYMRHFAQSGCAAIHHVAHEGEPHMAAYLIDHGADVNASSPGGWTPLHLAAWRVFIGTCDEGGDACALPPFSPIEPRANREEDDTAMVEVLLARGADVDAVNSLGETPLDRAEFPLASAKIAACLRAHRARSG
jgi:ankyrin repeat protein